MLYGNVTRGRLARHPRSVLSRIRHVKGKDDRDHRRHPDALLERRQGPRGDRGPPCRQVSLPVFVPFFFFFPLLAYILYAFPPLGRCRQSHGGAPAEDPDGRPSTTRSGPRPWPIEKTLSPDGLRTSLFAGCAPSACRPRFVSFGEKKEILGQHMDESPFFVLLYSVVSKGQRGRGNLFFV